MSGLCVCVCEGVEELISVCTKPPSPPPPSKACGQVIRNPGQLSDRDEPPNITQERLAIGTKRPFRDYGNWTERSVARSALNM